MGRRGFDGSGVQEESLIFRSFGDQKKIKIILQFSVKIGSCSYKYLEQTRGPFCVFTAT